MKKVKVSKLVVAMVSAALMAGCAGGINKSPVKIVNSKGELETVYLVVTTSGDSLDRSSSLTQLAKEYRDAEGNVVKGKDGKPVLVQISGDLQTGSTVGGDIARGMLNGTGAAAVQGQYGKDIAHINAGAVECPEGSTICHSTVLGGATAVSDSASQSDSQVDAVINSSMP